MRRLRELEDEVIGFESHVYWILHENSVCMDSQMYTLVIASVFICKWLATTYEYLTCDIVLRVGWKTMFGDLNEIFESSFK
jgi:hypothetical protein